MEEGGGGEQTGIRERERERMANRRSEVCFDREQDYRRPVRG